MNKNLNKEQCKDMISKVNITELLLSSNNKRLRKWTITTFKLMVRKAYLVGYLQRKKGI